MRVGVDATTWTNRRGYGRFTRGLVRSLLNRFPQHEFVLLADSHTARASQFPERAIIEVVETSVQQSQAASSTGSRSIADVVRMSRAAAKLRADVFLFPTTYSFFPVFARTPIVAVMHDASAESRPELIFPQRFSRLMWQAKSWLARKQTTQLVTVSDAARKQIAGVFNILPDTIAIVGEGTDAHFQVIDFSNRARETARVREQFGLPVDGNLVLYVGGISPHKNLESLLHGMVASRSTWHLAMVGDFEHDTFLSCHSDLVALASTLGVAHRVTFTGFVPDENLALLYNVATIFVMPSLTEGFGLPALEAMACGLPVAVSNTTSLPEVVGNAGKLVDPTSPSSIAGVIDELLQDADLRQELRDRGLVRASRYSWSLAADEMMQILERAVSTKRARARVRTDR